MRVSPTALEAHFWISCISRNPPRRGETRFYTSPCLQTKGGHLYTVQARPSWPVDTRTEECDVVRRGSTIQPDRAWPT